MPAARDLFDDLLPIPDGAAELPPELVHARALCRRIKRLKSRPDKIRCAHMICQNLLALLSKKST